MTEGRSPATRNPAAIPAAFLVALLALPSAAWAAQRTLTIEDGMCTGRLRYDPAKLDEARLKDTVRLLFDPGLTAPPLAPSPKSPAEMGTADPAAFATACRESRAAVDRLQPLDGFGDYQRLVSAQIADACAFGEAELKGLRDPAALAGYAPAAQACGHFVEALTAKADLTALWRQTVKRQCANNMDPAACEGREAARAAGPDAEGWRRLYLIDTGWNNCAVGFLKVNTDDHDRIREGLVSSFERRFKVKMSCDGG